MVHPDFSQAGMLVVAIGMIGATVMPHNLFLHTALVQTRQLQHDESSIRRAIRFNTIDTTVALAIAFFRQCSHFGASGDRVLWKDQRHCGGGQMVMFSPDSDWIRVAHLTLAPLLGTTLASTLFAVPFWPAAKAARSGHNAGQVVMEGFMHWRVRPWFGG